ncbi:MAG: hypothetical protein WDW36_004890 [Sanguina aurantia]
MPGFEARKQHSIAYSTNTSEIKDDIPALAACMNEAAFLLWFHALDGEDMVDELVGSGVINVCLIVLDNEDATPLDKSCAAGLLACIARVETSREDVVRGRGAAGNSCATVLHRMLGVGGTQIQQHILVTLRLVSEDTTARTALLRSLDQRLNHLPLYLHLLSNTNTAICSTTALFLHALLHKREDLIGAAVEGGLVTALVAALKAHKTELVCEALAACLLRLVEDRDSWAPLIAAGGICVLVDLLGPPPKSVTSWERQHFRDLIEPEWREGEASGAARRAAAGADAAEEADGAPVGEAAAAAVPAAGAAAKQAIPDASEFGFKAPLPKHKKAGDASIAGGALDGGGRAGNSTARSSKSTWETGAGTDSLTGDKQGGGTGPKAATQLQPPPILFSVNSAGLKWQPLNSWATQASAAGCLYHLAQDATHCREMIARLASHRVVPVLLSIMGGGGKAEAGAKKKKSKGVVLSSEALAAASNVTGLLKFLALENISRYRIAKLGAVPALISIYHDSSRLLLRRNAQVVLTNLALLAENGQMLMDAGLPEEFLVQVPMRLTPDEVDTLLADFPDCRLLPRARPEMVEDRYGRRHLAMTLQSHPHHAAPGAPQSLLGVAGFPATARAVGSSTLTEHELSGVPAAARCKVVYRHRYPPL